jgi:hypothetical protein
MSRLKHVQHYTKKSILNAKPLLTGNRLWTLQKNSLELFRFQINLFKIFQGCCLPNKRNLTIHILNKSVKLNIRFLDLFCNSFNGICKMMTNLDYFDLLKLIMSLVKFYY